MSYNGDISINVKTASLGKKIPVNLLSKTHVAISMKDWNHDLVHQLSEDLDSLWRYDTYLRTSEACDRCTAMWRKFKEMDEQKVQMLQGEILAHVKENNFD